MFSREIAKFIMEHPNTEVKIKYSDMMVGGPGIVIKFEMNVYDDAGRIQSSASESRTIHESEFDLADEFFETTYPVSDILKNLYIGDPHKKKHIRMHDRKEVRDDHKGSD